MHAQGILRVNRTWKSERHRQRRVVLSPSLPSPVFRAPTFPAAVRSWLSELPPQLRRARGCLLEELADQVIYKQLSNDYDRTNFQRVIEHVVELAEAHVEGTDRGRFVEVILHEPRLVEAGLLMALSQLALTQEIPRDQEFYPAVLFDREVLSVIKHVAERDKPALALLWALVGAHRREVVAEIEATVAEVERGFAKTTQWPSREVASRLSRQMQRLRSLWVSLARDLISAAEGAGGVLPMFAVESAAKPYELSRIDRTLFVESINRPRQKYSGLDLLRAARDWPWRAASILENLAGEFGSLRLYGAYLTAIWGGVAAFEPEDPDASTAMDRNGELVERDVAYPISASTGLLGPVVTLFEDACSYDVARKKRLSRQRERCLSGGISVMDSDFIDMLREIGSRYRCPDEPMGTSRVAQMSQETLASTGRTQCR